MSAVEPCQENMPFLTNRVGHVSVQYEDQLVIAWGGYDRSKDEFSSYYDPEQIVVYNALADRITLITTTGDIPPKTCGAAAVRHHDNMYVIGGFITSDMLVENTNTIYRLNLTTKVWTLLTPKMKEASDSNLLKGDKLSAWVHQNQIYIFGGYGPGPRSDPDVLFPPYFSYVLDPEYLRGWSNQCLIYDVEQNTMRWADCVGDVPGPRAAHASMCVNGTVWLFGGRFASNRLKEMYRGQIVGAENATIHWTQINPQQMPWPCGRSWHTLNSTGSDDTIVLYGGYDKKRKPLNDCWLFNTRQNIWRQLYHQSKENRLWHTAHFVRALDSLILVGGVRHDIMNDVADMHPGTLDRIQLSPLSLAQTALQVVLTNEALYYDWSSLPQNIKSQIESWQALSKHGS